MHGRLRRNFHNAHIEQTNYDIDQIIAELDDTIEILKNSPAKAEAEKIDAALTAASQKAEDARDWIESAKTEADIAAAIAQVDEARSQVEALAEQIDILEAAYIAPTGELNGLFEESLDEDTASDTEGHRE